MNAVTVVPLAREVHNLMPIWPQIQQPLQQVEEIYRL